MIVVMVIISNGDGTWVMKTVSEFLVDGNGSGGDGERCV